MKKRSIKKHLSQYSILAKRRTTINHAFASAIAPTDVFDGDRIDEAIVSLGQNPDADLVCVYCDRPAADWDHLVGLVEKSELRGFGHQLGNLVPCCKECNSAKGAKDWKLYLASITADPEALNKKICTLESYLHQFAVEINLAKAQDIEPEAWARYGELKAEILRLMNEADAVAAVLRKALARTQPN